MSCTPGTNMVDKTTRWPSVEYLRPRHSAVASTVGEATGAVVGALTEAASVATHGNTSRRTRAGGDSRVAAEHGHTGTVLGATKGDHVLANVAGDDLATLSIGVAEDVLDQVVSELVTSDINERHTRAVSASLANTVKVAVKELGAANLEALLDNLAGKLVHAVLGSEAKDVIDGVVAVRDGAVLADVLDAPVAELTMGDNVDAGKDLVDAGALVLLKAVLEDVLDDKTASLTEGNLVPHAAESFVDVLHDLRRGVAPAEFEQLLPDVTGVTVNNRLRNAAQKLVDHDGLVLLRNTVESLLNNVAAKRIHAQVEGVVADSTSNGDDLLGSAMLKAVLDQEVAEAVDHERVGLFNDGLDDLILLLLGANLELLLKEDRCLLVVAVDDLVDNVLPVAAHVAVQKTTVVHGLGVGEVAAGLRQGLETISGCADRRHGYAQGAN